LTNLTVPVVRTFRAHPAALHEIRNFVRHTVQAQLFPAPAVDDMVLAVDEAASNVIAHTNSALIELTVWANETLIEIQVRDTGIFRRRLPMPELDGHGRGIPLMMALTDRLELTQGTEHRPGTVVKLVKNREP
jgi:anti-sigma regulatory factor (Ser/Thr protein kinase)